MQTFDSWQTGKTFVIRSAGNERLCRRVRDNNFLIVCFKALLNFFFFSYQCNLPLPSTLFHHTVVVFLLLIFAQIPDLSRRWKCLVNAVTVSRGEAVRSEWPLHRRVNGPSVSSLVRSACISAQVREKTKQVQQLQCEVCLTQTRSVAEHSQHTTNSTPALLE